MKAMVQDKYGEAEDVLRLADIERPQIAANEVLLRVHAAGLDRGVWHSMAGLPYPIRLAGYGVRAPKNPVIGSDLAGRVEAVGHDVTNVEVGDDVYGVGRGSFAEYSRATADKLARMPRNLTYEQAAALPVSACTALQAVRDRAKVQPGQQVLVIGASGGVGTYIVQIAKAFGGIVTGVSSAGKADLVRSLGAERVIDYAAEDFAAEGKRYDVILDTGGMASLTRLRRALTPRGTLVIVGGETGGRFLGGSERALRAMAVSPFVGQKLGTFVASANADDLNELRGLVESGQVTPAVDRTYPLSGVAEAIHYMQAGKVRGKVVIMLEQE
jgi:NADPH:quinone reductase-like Zn-dependent oxidoreductase